MTRLPALWSAALATFLVTAPVSAQSAYQWTGAAGSNWNNSANWTPGAIPNNPNDFVVFTEPATPPFNVNIASSVQIGALYFQVLGPAASYTLTSSAGQTLSGVAEIGVFGESAVHTINLTNVATGNLLISSTGLTINQFAPDATLVLGPGTVIGGGGGGQGVTVNAIGPVTLSGGVTSSVNGPFIKIGSGTLTIRSAGNMAASGATVLRSGRIVLDYAGGANNKLAGDRLRLEGGRLELRAHPTTAFTQGTVFGSHVSTGHSDVFLNTTGGTTAAVTLAFGFISRTTGATLDLTLDTNAVATTAETTTLNLVGPYFTMTGGATWATKSGANVLPLTGFGTNSYIAAVNTDVTTGTGIPAGFTSNSLRFNTPGLTATLSGVNRVNSGGILQTPAAGATTITGGTLTGAGGTTELITHVYGTSLTVASSLATSGGLTKAGPGTLVLAAANPGLTGPVTVARGGLTITTPAAVNAAAAVRFTDTRGDVAPLFTVDLGAGVAGTLTPNIVLSQTDPFLNTTFSTGASQFSRVTLAGVISSAAGGDDTPLELTGSPTNTSGFNLTGANTVSGGVTLTHGTLGINSASPFSGRLTLQVDDGAAGGLEFLTGGITLPNPVDLLGLERVASHGSDVNTLAGPVSFGGLVKVGTGTLVLTNLANTHAFTLIDAGTVRVSADGPLGIAGGGIGIAGGATLATTDTFTTPRGAFLGLETGVGTGTIHVAGGTTLTVQGTIADASGTTGGVGGLSKAGPGTLVLTTATNTYTGGTTISQGRMRVSAAAALGTGPLTLDGGTLDYAGPTLTWTRPLMLATGGGFDVSSAATTVTVTAPVTGGGGLTKGGLGLLVLGTTGGSFAGGITVAAGRLELAADANLGSAAVTVHPGGTVRYTAGTTAARTFNLLGGTLEATAGVSLTLNQATVNGGFLRGTGTYVLTGGTSLTGVTTFNTTILSQTGAAAYTNFSNGGALTVSAATANPAVLNGFTNQGSGSITVSAGGNFNAADFQTYGVMTLSPGTTAVPTQLTNGGSSSLFLNGGSRTFIATPATASQFAAGIDLNGKNAVVAGGLLVNNGYVVDSAPGGPGRVIADFGSLVKGAGFYQSPVVTQNGGRFQAGNSPGVATFGEFTFGPGGVDRYVFSINDADGAAGQAWGLVNTERRQLGPTTTSGDFTWTADSSRKVTVALETLVGGALAGPMADFDPTQPYSWPAVRWSGDYDGPPEAALAAATVFSTSDFLNPIGGTFGWRLDVGGQTLSLTYTPVPEPSALALLGAAAATAWWSRRQRRASSAGR